MSEDRLDFPSAKPGYLLGLMALGLHLILLFLYQGEGVSPTGMFEFIYFIAIWPGMIYWLVAIYQTHRILQRETGGQYPVTPGRGAFFNLIPFFQLYWIFKWPGEMAKLVNRISGEERINPVMPALGLLAALFVGRMAEGGVALLINFLVLDKLNKAVREAAAPDRLPVHDYREKFHAVPVGGWHDLAALLCVAVPLVVMGYMVVSTGTP